MDEILGRISALLTTRFGVAADEVSADSVLADLDLDSLALVEFGLVAEKEFGVRITEDEVSPNHTVSYLAELILAKAPVA
ncbi:MAG TPA: phosphopantetheine-binding protein [Micromonosporaceae bacterium]|nr:phosphopantetheine-binding protein [Micromonosporaceae bacterium]